MNNKAVLYLRLSKEDRNKVNKGDDSESIINQRIMLSNYAMRHNFQVVKIYSDDDESGLYEDRPGFSQMMQDAERGLFGTIIAKSQSRIYSKSGTFRKIFTSQTAIMGCSIYWCCRWRGYDG